MSKVMKICSICKTPIEDGIEVFTEVGHVHPGPCLHMACERENSLNESVSTDEIQMIM